MCKHVELEGMLLNIAFNNVNGESNFAMAA